jgi:hypothetical protein
MRLKSLAAVFAALVLACATVPVEAASAKHPATKQTTTEKHRKHKHHKKHKHKEQAKHGKKATTLKSQKHGNA